MPETDVTPEAGNLGGTSPKATDNPQDWRTSLPEDLRSEKVFEQIKAKDAAEALPVLAKNYVNASKLVGQKTDGMIRVPGKDAKPEDVASFRKALGVPDAPDKYELKTPASMAPVFGDPVRQAFATKAHELGMTTAQAQGLLEWYGGNVAAQQQAVGMQRRDVEQSLKTEWGGAYDKNLALAQRALAQSPDGPALMKYLDDTGLGNHPALVRAFAWMGSLLAEDGHIPNDEIASTSADATAELTKILNDKDHPYWRRSKPGHDEAVQRVSELQQMLHSNL